MELPAMLDAHGLAVLFLVGIALVLFTRERIPLETASLAVLVLLVLALNFSLWRRGRADSCDRLLYGLRA